jgi:heptosyltransferase II
MSAGERILLVAPAWVGDMVMMHALVQLLRAADPAAVIDVVAPAASLPIARRMPEVRQTHLLDAAHGELALGARWRLGRALAAERYDRAIVLPRSFKSALVPLIAGATRRTGFGTELRRFLLNDPRPLDRAVLDQTVKRFLTLGLPAGAQLPAVAQPRLRIDTDNLARLRAAQGLAATGAIALLPGAAYGPAKQWPVEHWGALARALAGAGRTAWILGSPAERLLGEQIRVIGGEGVVNLCGTTTLEDTVDLLHAAAAAVSNDSGLMHVAAAAGTHVIALYGSSSPTFTPPLTDRATIHSLGLDCSPCFQRTCPLGHLRCLRDLTPDRVLASIPALDLSRHGAGNPPTTWSSPS